MARPVRGTGVKRRPGDDRSQVKAGISMSGQVYCSYCLMNMEPMSGVRLPAIEGAQPGRWFWWRCPRGHITEALPLPDSLVPSGGTGTVYNVMHRGSEGLQPPRVAEPPEDSLRSR